MTTSTSLMIYREIYNKGAEILQSAGIEEASIDARLLLEFICGTDRNTLLAHPDREVSAEESMQYMELIEKRSKRIPLQHITGEQEFMGITFKVDGRVLIPRQDTECLVEEALTYVEDGMRVLDMCTGSGCILLSLMNYRRIEGVACDFSEGALSVAKENADALMLNPELIKSDMFSGIPDNYYRYFDVVISNPPYIRKDVIPTLMDEVKNHDPMMALDGGDDGLDFYRILAKEAPKYLTNYGRMYLEIGYDQGEEVAKLLEENGFSDIKIIKDYSGNDRVVIGKHIIDTKK